MGYVKPIPVKQEDLSAGNDYYTCNFTGTVKVTLLKIFADLLFKELPLQRNIVPCMRNKPEKI